MVAGSVPTSGTVSFCPFYMLLTYIKILANNIPLYFPWLSCLTVLGNVVSNKEKRALKVSLPSFSLFQSTSDSQTCHITAESIAVQAV